MSGTQFSGAVALNYSPAMSPTLSSYQGMSGSELIGLANAQSRYNPQPPAANYQQADQYVEAAANATDPNLKQQLLQQAIALLRPGGSQAQPQPIQGGASPAPISSAPVNSAPVSGGAGLSVSGNSVNTGEYTITGSTKDDGSLTITDNKTGQSTEVWGDPHVKVNGQDTAEFQKGPLNIQLQDGTTVHIDPTALSNGVAHIGQVSITQGNQTVTMGGANGGGFQSGVNTSDVMNGVAGYQSSLYNAPNATDITLGADGNLYYNNANGSMGNEITAKAGGGETNLDGAGGGLVGQPSASTGGSASSGSLQSSMDQLMGLLAQNQNSFYSIMMQQTLSQMMSQSGFAQA